MKHYQINKEGTRVACKKIMRKKANVNKHKS